MEFRRIRKRKNPNYKRALLLIILLLVMIYFWLHAEDIIGRYLSK